MKIMKKSLFVCFAVGIMLTFTNCGKKGCTDSDAKNFCDECKKDDGSCSFQAKGVFWYNQTTSQNLIADGATSLTFYVDGQIIGSSGTNVYFTSSPSCGQNGSASVTKDLGKNKSQSFSYSIKDQRGKEYWKGTLNMSSANACLAISLTW